MPSRIFGVSMATIIVVVITAIVVRKWGSHIPLLAKVS